jgi:hypothetical protein
MTLSSSGSGSLPLLISYHLLLGTGDGIILSRGCLYHSAKVFISIPYLCCSDIESNLRPILGSLIRLHFFQSKTHITKQKPKKAKEAYDNLILIGLAVNINEFIKIYKTHAVVIYFTILLLTVLLLCLISAAKND